MRKLLLCVAFALPLAFGTAGCQSLQQAGSVIGSISQVENITMRDVYVLRAGYDAAVLAPAANYRRLPLCECAPAPCAERRVVLQLQKADRVAENALDALERFVRNNPGKIGASGLCDAAKAAISQAQAIILEYRIGTVS